MGPCQHGSTTKFLPIVSANHLWQAAGRGQMIEDPRDMLTADDVPTQWQPTPKSRHPRSLNT